MSTAHGPSAAAGPAFSWTDSLHIAVASCSSCIPCLRRVPSDDSLCHPTAHGIPRARPDELQGLLSSSSSDSEGERLSLHSNFGRNASARRRMRDAATKKGKKITLFGFELFGRRKGVASAAAPIYLPDGDDEDDALYHAIGAETGSAQRQKQSSRRGDDHDDVGSSATATSGSLTAATSVTTFDLDAAPLSPTLIAELSSSTSAAALIAAAEETRVREDEERRCRRRERRAQKEGRDDRWDLERLKEEGVLPEDGDGSQFEGFQGSGSAVPVPFLVDVLCEGRVGALDSRRTSSEGASVSGGGHERQGSGNREEFGQFVEAGAREQVEEEEEEAADFDGGLYSGKRRPYSRASDSRSRKSPPHSASGERNPSSKQTPKSLKTSKSGPPSRSSRTTQSHSSTSSTSQSVSPVSPSPLSTAFPADAHTLVSPSTIEQGLGFFDAEDVSSLDVGPQRKDEGGGMFDRPPSVFPSTGLSGNGGRTREARDVAAFLAKRG